MTTAYNTFGLVLAKAGTAIAQVRLTGGPKLKAESIETTNHDSTGGYEEAIQGIRRSGEVTMEGIFKPADTNGQIALITDFNAGTISAYTITFPTATGTVWSFNAFVASFELDDAPINGVMGFKASLKVTGKPTLTVAASAGLTNPFFSIDESAVLTPAAAGDVYDYVATVLVDVTSVKVTPTATAGTITVNGNTVGTGVASGSIALGAAGTNTTITIVVTETGKSPKTYTIRVARAAS